MIPGGNHSFTKEPGSKIRTITHLFNLKTIENHPRQQFLPVHYCVGVHHKGMAEVADPRANGAETAPVGGDRGGQAPAEKPSFAQLIVKVGLCQLVSEERKGIQVLSVIQVTDESRGHGDHFSEGT